MISFMYEVSFVLHDIACYYIWIYHHQATHITKCQTLYVAKTGVASECIKL